MTKTRRTLFLAVVLAFLVNPTVLLAFDPAKFCNECRSFCAVSSGWASASLSITYSNAAKVAYAKYKQCLANRCNKWGRWGPNLEYPGVLCGYE